MYGTQSNLTLGMAIQIIEGVLKGFTLPHPYYWSCSKLYVSHGSITYAPVLYKEPKNPFLTAEPITFYKSGLIGINAPTGEHESHQFKSVPNSIETILTSLNKTYTSDLTQPTGTPNGSDMPIKALIELCNLVEYHAAGGGECLLKVIPNSDQSSLTLSIQDAPQVIMRWPLDEEWAANFEDVEVISHPATLYLGMLGLPTAV